MTINENADPDVARDVLAGPARLVPAQGDYSRAEGNSDAHIKASLVGFSAMIPVIDGRLPPGTWQGVYVCEFDGPQRRVLIGVAEELGEGPPPVLNAGPASGVVEEPDNVGEVTLTASK